jgi:glutamyl-tRNA reductase
MTNNRQDRKSTPVANPYRTVSASQRRAERRAKTGGGAPAPAAVAREQSNAIPQALINQLLHNPTKTVSEDELKQTYSYVIADIRNMALLALVLVVVLFVLAFTLPR